MSPSPTHVLVLLHHPHRQRRVRPQPPPGRATSRLSPAHGGEARPAPEGGAPRLLPSRLPPSLPAAPPAQRFPLPEPGCCGPGRAVLGGGAAGGLGARLAAGGRGRPGAGSGRGAGKERGRAPLWDLGAGLGASFTEPGEGVDVVVAAGGRGFNEGTAVTSRVNLFSRVMGRGWIVLSVFQFTSISMKTAPPKIAAEGALK